MKSCAHGRSSFQCAWCVAASMAWFNGPPVLRSMSKGQAASQLRKLGLKRGKRGTDDDTAAMDSDSGVRSGAGRQGNTGPAI